MVRTRSGQSSRADIEISPSEYRAQMWQRYRPAFDLCRRTMELLENRITVSRAHGASFSKAIELLFLQCYKSFSGVYILAVSGQGEDAGTIARRLLELTWQMMALNGAESQEQKEEWAKRCLAYFFGFWPQMKETVATSWPENEVKYWEDAYADHSELIELDRHGWPRNWWPKVDHQGNTTEERGGFVHLATLAGVGDSYENDYRILSQMAHGLASGFLFAMRQGRIEVRSERMIDVIVVWATSYMLSAASIWNAEFQLLPEENLKQLRAEAISMKQTMATRPFSPLDSMQETPRP